MLEFQQILERAKAGDPDAADALLRAHLEPLQAFVRLRTGGALRARESCSDLVQSACREALDDLSHVEFDDEGAFRAWLCTVALNKVRGRAAHFAAAKRDAARELPADECTSLLDAYRTVFTPSQEAAAREEVERLEAAVDRLSDDDRELVLQLRLLGRSHRDVAAELGKSEVAVRKALSRALARLALILERGDG